MLYPLIAAIGIGGLFQVPLIGLQAAMPLRDMATSTATFGFLRCAYIYFQWLVRRSDLDVFRTLGGTIGVSVGEAILSSELRKKIRNIPDLNIDTSPSALNQIVRQIKDIQVRPVILSEHSNVSLMALFCSLCPRATRSNKRMRSLLARFGLCVLRSLE